tara:strand:- start:12170 stop:12577 length:408 start_codon:yes stop_codon:yes gene_type:complete
MTEETYDKIMSMVASSPYHCVWDEESVDNHIHTPMVLGQFVLGGNDDDSLFFFATFAHPEEAHIQEYLRTGTFPVEGYYANGKNVWIIDFICLGGVKDITVSFRCLKNLLSSMGHTQCFWLRTNKNKIGFHILKE